MVRWLREIEGFDGFVMLTGEGSAIGLSFWESATSLPGIGSLAVSSSSA